MPKRPAPRLLVVGALLTLPVLASALGACKLLKHDSDSTDPSATAVATLTTATVTAPATATAAAPDTAAATSTAANSGASAAAAGGLPAGWPIYAPQYPGSTIVRTTSDAESKYMLQESKDSRDKIVTFYQDKFKESGMGHAVAASMGSGATAVKIVTVSKGADMCVLTVTPAGDKTKISTSITF